MSSYTQRALADLAHLDQLTQQFLDLGGISRPPTPENLVSIFDPSRRILIATRPLGDIRGVLKPDGPGGWLIVVNSRLSRYARRFSVFHEGYHILERIGAVNQLGNQEYGEWLADNFAARVLMPRRWLLEWAPKLTEEQMVVRFKVSYSALHKRLRQLGREDGHEAETGTWRGYDLQRADGHLAR